MPGRPFRPAWWLPGPHLQTLWPYLFSPRRRLALRRERLELPDGDFLDLDWTPPLPGPLVLVLHGLEGSSESGYIRRLTPVLAAHGMQSAILHFRGCSGEPNRLPRAYHAGETQDLARVIRHLRMRQPTRPLGAIGFSLGGNVLLKWLGESASDSPLTAAAAVSVPFDLQAAAARLERGASRIYQSYLLRPLRRAQIRKHKLRGIPPPVARDTLARLRTLREFDDRITAPLHGFAGVEDYYRRSSSRPWLHRIETPTLIVQARDDPFLLPHGIPGADELSAAVRLELTDTGGHVGFVSGPMPGLSRPWLESRLAAWLEAHCVSEVRRGDTSAPPQSEA
ncbi:hydrolase [Acidihalobacter prosperus]|uniref:Alpha/beta hydrolase n=1 Tax=Acidihalobacter prosperus TaxID=160660 RepID=A0A1A6C8W5_9GAMM|nr:hydrolase [Acidihalobacter prosperus]OBS10989.1 alpha/beta hydrolase [Acidihalobacter prosperus]